MPRTRPLLLALLLALVPASGCVVVEGGGSPGSVATAPAPGTPPDDAADGPAEERMARALFDRVNAEREARGLQPVAWDDALAEVAADWSEAMAGTGVLEHQDIRSLLDRDDLEGFAGIGENVFTASGPVPAGVAHVGWMRSDGHRVNVLNPGWNRLGVGVFCAPDGSTWATQQFGRTVDADRPEVSDETPPTEPIARPEEDGPSCG
ncbi:CAP domain-containing protein [Blastococcus sp. SYSU DS0617]